MPFLQNGVHKLEKKNEKTPHRRALWKCTKNGAKTNYSEKKERVENAKDYNKTGIFFYAYFGQNDAAL